MDSFPVCTHCGFTFGEYRARGLLGCPHCYSGFGEALQADVAWLHHALAFADAEPPAPPLPDAESLARWREQIAEAVRTENYEEAARLNRLIRGLGPSTTGAEPPDAAEKGLRSPRPGGPVAGGQRPGLGLV
jgi:protein arginine kinase activator